MTPPPSEQSTPTDQIRWFTEEVHAHESSLRSYLSRLFPTRRDVDDVVQESYLRIWKARSARPIQSAKTFLFRIARHIVIDSARRQRISPVETVNDLAELAVAEEQPSAVDTMGTAEDFDALTAAIDSLPARCREIIILRKLRGVPQKAIAAQLGISELTVQVQVYRGVKRLEEIMSRRRE